MPAEGEGSGARRVERLERLLEVGRGLLAELELDAVLGRVLDAAMELTGARYAALGVLDRERRALERFITRGIDDETRRRIGDYPQGRGVLGELIHDPRPLRLSDVGSHARSYGFPLGHPPMRSFLGVPVTVRGEPWGNLYLTEAAAGEFTAADEDDVSVLADWAAIAVGNARSYTLVAGRGEELQRALSQLEATTEIAKALAGETDLERILELVAKRARALTDARGAVVMLMAGSSFRLAATAGDVGTAAVGDRFAAEQTVAGRVLATERSERLADAPSRLQFALARATGARTGLFVPLLFHGRGVGVLEVFDRLEDGPEFSVADERLLEAFAASAAAAVATAQTVAADALRRSVEAQEAERTRWARELHDETLQELAATKLLLGRLLQLEQPREEARLIEQASALLDSTVRGLRHMITELRPAQLDEQGLAAALEALADRARVLAEVELDVEVDLAQEAGREPERLSKEVETAVYRVAQEGLTNAVKHARAKRIELRVREDRDAVTLSIRDDGSGFDTDAVSRGFGLLGMRERIALAGGSISLESAPGAGTMLSVIVPSGRRAGTPVAASGS